MRCVRGLILFYCLFLVGCGGGSSSPPAAVAQNSPFTGRYVGTFNDPVNKQHGTLDLTVSSDGQLSGTAQNVTTGQSASMAGVVDTTGDAKVVFVYPGVTYTGEGVLSGISAQHLTGEITTFLNGTYAGYSSVDITRQ